MILLEASSPSRVGEGREASHVIFTDTRLGSLSLQLFDTFPAGEVGYLFAALQRWKVKAYRQTFAWVDWATISFLCCLAGVEQSLIKVSALPGFSSPSPLTRESRILIRIFLFVSFGISGFLASVALCLWYMRPKKTLGTRKFTTRFPQVLNALDSMASPVHLCVFMFVLRITSRIFSCA